MAGTPYGSPLPKSELRTLNFIAQGNRAPDAHKINRALNTIKTQLNFAFKRLGARSAGHAIAIAYATEQLHIPRTEHVPLEARENEILVCLAKGLTRQQMETQLELTEAQVKYSLKRLYRKLGAKGSAHAVYRGFQTGNLTVNRRKHSEQ